MVGDEKVEYFVCQSVESISVLSHHREWDNRNDYIVREIAPIYHVCISST